MSARTASRELQDGSGFVRLITDLSWGPPGTRARSHGALEYSVCPLDIVELNAVHLRAGESPVDPGSVAAVVDQHRGRRSRWQGPRSAFSPDLEQALSDAGYTKLVTQLMVRPLTEIPPSEDIASGFHEVCDLDTLRTWHGVRVASGRTAGVPVEELLLAELRLRESSGLRFRQILHLVEGQPSSAGGLLLDATGEAALLWGGGTATVARGQGRYRALVRARLSLARSLGCATAYAVAIEGRSVEPLAREGFEPLAPYLTWERPP